MICKDIHQPEKGFYYDLQLNNPLLKVSLHPSTEPGPAPKYSQEYSGEKLEDGFYGKAPLCQSIITEDFQVSIANQMSNFGGDPIGELWNSAVKPYSPYIDEVKEDLISIGEKTKAAANKMFSDGSNDKGSKLNEFFRKAGNSLGDVVKSIGEYGSDITKRSLIIQGTQFSYYSGTGVDFGNLSMKFVIFSGYDATGVYRSVKEEVEKISWYIIGPMEPVTEVKSDLVKEFAMWQLPPGGYVANVKNIDKNQYGTVKLLVGPYYSIENLIIQSAQFNYSKTLCKHPQDEKSIVPLYCEVTLNLKAVSKFSEKRVFEFAHGVKSQNYRTDLENQIKGDLSSIASIAHSPSGIKSC